MGEVKADGTAAGGLVDRDGLLDELVALSHRAGDVISEVYADHDPEVATKADSSPVTEADVRAEALILPRLRELTPDIPIVAEEAVSRGEVPEVGVGAFWLVDPLDGTKEFLSRNGEFTVNIALVEQGVPTTGVVYAPVLATTYVGHPGGAQRRTGGSGASDPQVHPLRVREVPGEGYDVLVSRSHLDGETESWLSQLSVRATVSAGSSLKFCRIAEAAADLYPRFGRTMAWDTAAGHAVLRAAGGQVTQRSGSPLRYGGPDFANPAFVAFGATAPPGLGG